MASDGLASRRSRATISRGDRFESIDRRVLGAERNIKKVCEAEGLELGLGRIVGQRSDLKAARLARLKKFRKTGLNTRREQRQRFAFHPPRDARRDHIRVDAGPLAGAIDLRCRDVARNWAIAHVLLGAPIRLQNSCGSPSQERGPDVRTEETDQHRFPESILLVQRAVDVEHNRFDR